MKSVKKNNGYSLVEMIIVLAIIAVMSGMAILSISLIHSAKAKDAATKLDSEVATLLTRSKNMDANVTISGTKYDSFCLIIKKSGDECLMIPGYYQSSATDWSAGTYVEDPDTSLQKSLSPYVDLEFKGTNMDSAFDGEPNSTGIIIAFDKRGNCLSGYGEWKFKKKNGNKVGRVVIRQNGSHELR